MRTYLCFTNFETQIALRFVPVASAAVHVSLRRARGMSDKQFVYADRAVFSTSKVYSDALFIKHKYVQDDVK